MAEIFLNESVDNNIISGFRNCNDKDSPLKEKQNYYFYSVEQVQKTKKILPF